MSRLYLGLAALAACSPVVAHTPDAPPTIDSSPDAPGHGMVSVKVYDPNNTAAVVVGVPVVFIEADGTQVGHPATGADGVASADVHANATATVVITTQGSTQMQTVTGLQPGDMIILGPTNGTPTSAGTFSVTFPSFSGATNYDVYGPCGSTNGTALTLVLQMQTDCKLDTMDITVVPKDASGNPLVYLTKTGVAFVAGGSTTVTGNYTGLSPFTASYTNINAIVTSINVSRAVPDGLGFSKSTQGTPANGTLSLLAPGPAGTKAIVTSNFSTATGGQLFQQAIPGNGQTYGLDVGASLLPWLGAPTYDLTTHKLTVTTDTTGTTNDAPDLFFAQAAYSRTVGMTTTSYAWLIFAAAPGELTLPTLPVDVGDVMSKATDTPQGTFAGMVEADTLNGYNDVRLDVYKKTNSVTDPPHPTAMRVREATALSR